MSFRKLTLQKLADLSTPNLRSLALHVKNSGKLTDLVTQELGTPFSSFREAYSKMKPGPKKEKLVLDTIISRGIKPATAPVTVKLPNGTKITYRVTKDYVKIDGIRVAMSGETAQKVAKHFKMHLPTKKQVDQIYQAAKTKIDAKPFSGTGVTIDGRKYTPQEIVALKIGDADTNIAYSELVDSQIQESGNLDGIIAGPFKNIIQPKTKGKLNLYGGRAGGRVIQPEGTGHGTAYHGEYMTPLRLVDGPVTVTKPDGSTQKTNMKDLLEDPELYTSVTDRRGYSQY